MTNPTNIDPATIRAIRRATRGRSPGAQNLRYACDVALARPEYAPAWMRQREAEYVVRVAAGVAMMRWVRAMAVAS